MRQVILFSIYSIVRRWRRNLTKNRRKRRLLLIGSNSFFFCISRLIVLDLEQIL